MDVDDDDDFVDKANEDDDDVDDDDDDDDIDNDNDVDDDIDDGNVLVCCSASLRCQRKRFGDKQDNRSMETRQRWKARVIHWSRFYWQRSGDGPAVCFTSKNKCKARAPSARRQEEDDARSG